MKARFSHKIRHRANCLHPVSSAAAPAPVIERFSGHIYNHKDAFRCVVVRNRI